MTEQEVQIRDALLGKTISALYVHTFLEDNSGVDWIAVDFSDGLQVEIHASGGWAGEGFIDVELGTRARDIYKVAAW